MPERRLSEECLSPNMNAKWTALREIHEIPESRPIRMLQMCSRAEYSRKNPESCFHWISKSKQISKSQWRVWWSVYPKRATDFTTSHKFCFARRAEAGRAIKFNSISRQPIFSSETSWRQFRCSWANSSGQKRRRFRRCFRNQDQLRNFQLTRFRLLCQRDSIERLIKHLIQFPLLQMEESIDVLFLNRASESMPPRDRARSGRIVESIKAKRLLIMQFVSQQASSSDH